LGNGETKNLNDIFRGFYLKKADIAFENIAKALDKLEHTYR
jgi:hypothetical protein